MSIADKTNALLGLNAKDKVTGFEGVITTVCFDLYGCIQLALTPFAKKGDQELKASHWFDVARLEVSNVRVMDAPDFDAKGSSPAEYTHGAAPKPARAANGQR